MKYLLMAIALSTVIHGYAAAKTSTNNSLVSKGTVERLLMTPEGDVDGFLLSDGTQVSFDPHMSDQLTAVVAPKDKVEVRGFRSNSKVLKAETITNVKTYKIVTATAPISMKGNQALSVQGTILNNIYNPNGVLSGFILSDGSEIHFEPRLLNDSGVMSDIGQKLKASGNGTRNAFGQSLQATQLSNY
jgi:hypothetical protein